MECEEMHYVMIKVWNPQDWTLSMPVELWISKMGSLAEFAAVLSSKLDIPKEHILCAKVGSPWNFHRVELPYIGWVNLTSETQGLNSISQEPYYLSTDGILFVVRDARTEIRDMTIEEKELYKCEEYEQWLMSGGAKGQGAGPGKTTGVRKQEQGIKIRVKTK